MQSVVIHFIINGTTIEDRFKSERIAYQHWEDKRAKITLFTADNKPKAYIAYAQAERILILVDEAFEYLVSTGVSQPDTKQ